MYSIGTTEENLTDLAELGLPYPQAEVPDYSLYITAGDGSEQGQGGLTFAWRFPFFSVEDYLVLMTYTGQTVYVETLTHEDEYLVYQALMIAPQRKAPKVGDSLDVTFRFRLAIEVEEE